MTLVHRSLYCQPMKNKITSSTFSSKGVRTSIENPSNLIMTLMTGISLEEPENFHGLDEWHFHHHDIGTKEKMEELFESLERVAK